MKRMFGELCLLLGFYYGTHFLDIFTWHLATIELSFFMGFAASTTIIYLRLRKQPLEPKLQ